MKFRFHLYIFASLAALTIPYDAVAANSPVRASNPVPIVRAQIGFAHAVENRTSICRLARDNAQMHGRQVRLTAIYSTDLSEHSSLNDRHCPNSYLEPNWDASRDASVGLFDEALYAHPNDPEPIRYRIDVSGQFWWHSGARPYGELIFGKVWSFERLGDVQKNSK